MILSTLEVLVDCFKAWVYNLDGFAGFVMVLIPLKYFGIVLTSLLDLARSRGGEGAFSIETGTGLAISFLLLFLLSVAPRVNLEEIFALRVLVFLSVWRESYLALYTDEIKFQMASPIPSKSLRSFTLLLLTCLLVIYFTMKSRVTLIFFVSNVKCSIEL